MAKGIPWLNFSAFFKKDRSSAYEKWSFPYGAAQRQAVTGLLAQLLPGQDPVFTLSAYLNGRDLYRGRFEEFTDDWEAEKRLAALALELPNQLREAHKADLPLYAALIEADFAVDERLQYPDAEALRRRAAALASQLAD